MPFIQKLCPVSKLGEALNEVEALGFVVDKYEHAFDAFDGPVWFVVGYKDPEDIN